MAGLRYNDGLHQAIEAKEKGHRARESKTLATITFQNYFRLYKKLSGMTGTALTEEEEFNATYKLDIVEVPTNKPLIRQDHPDVVFKNTTGKYHAIVRQIVECHEKGQPVLAGTTSIEKSELLSAAHQAGHQAQRPQRQKTKRRKPRSWPRPASSAPSPWPPTWPAVAPTLCWGQCGVFGQERPAEGRPVRRDDRRGHRLLPRPTTRRSWPPGRCSPRPRPSIREALAPEAEKVRQVGGLFILGTERHESRRIDNQLRGRAYRQGDPGESRFFLCLEDDIMRLFGTERMQKMMETLKIDDDTPIDAKVLSGAIENAQKKVESKNFQARKNTLEYDDVMNVQREIIYKQRRQVLDGENMGSHIRNMLHRWIEESVRGHQGEHKHLTAESWQLATEPFRGLFFPRSSSSTPMRSWPPRAPMP